MITGTASIPSPRPYPHSTSVLRSPRFSPSSVTVIGSSIFGRFQPKKRGFSLIEVALSLAIVGLASAGIIQGSDDASRQIKDGAAADHMKTIETAVTQYIQANPGLATTIPVGGSTVLPVARTSSTAAIPASSLQSQGYLSPNFVDTNSYGQTSEVVLRQPTSGNIQALVTTTGGQTIDDVDLGRIAAKVGAVGGVIDTTPPPGVAAGTMLGAGGGWAEPASDWTASGVTPAAGHVVAVNYLSQVASLQDFLYRNNIGIHEANTMHTAIDMTGNAINAVGYLDNVNPTTGASNGPISVGSALQGSTANSPLQIQNGAQVCASQTAGCTVNFGSNLALALEGDGWLSQTDANNVGRGFHVQVNSAGSGGALMVDKGSTLTGTVATYGGVQLYNGTTLTFPGTNGSTAYLGADSRNGNFLEIYGSNNGLFANTLQAGTLVEAPTVYGNVVNAGIDMSAPIYYDSDNSSFYVQPRGTSNLNVLDANSINATGAVSADTAWGGAGTEFDGPDFSVNYNGNNTATETLNGQMTVNGNENVSGTVTGSGGVVTGAVATAGNSCSGIPAGEMAQDSSGNGVDMCQNGTWVNQVQGKHYVGFSDFAGQNSNGPEIAYYSGSHSNPSSSLPMWCHSDTQNVNSNYAVREEVYSGGAEAGNTAGIEDTTVSFVVQPGQQFYIYESADWDGLGTQDNFGEAIATFCWY